MEKLADHELFVLQHLMRKLNNHVEEFSTNFDKDENLIGNKEIVENLKRDIIDDALTIASNLNLMDYE